VKPEIQLNYKWTTKGEFYMLFSVFLLVIPNSQRSQILKAPVG